MSFENDFVKLTFDKQTLYVKVIAKKDLPANDTEFDDFLTYFNNFYQACYKINQKIILFYDLKELGLLKYEQYNKWTELFHKYENITNKCLICSSIVCDNSIIANFINGVLLFYNNQKPVKIFTSQDDAIKFINEHLK
tara:strand:+ start:435 stop:848 length:414 start_codon:yes stop_codon:yes gene_type:complete